MIGKRSKIDFSNHEVILNQDTSGLVVTVKIPNTSMNSVVFINSNGIMAVTGDFGNWIFCREFHPLQGEKSKVSDSYWLEKLKIASVQEPSKYDSEATRESLEKLIADKEHSKEVRNFYKELLDYVEDEIEYTYEAYRSYKCPVDFDDIPFEKKLNNWLLAIFDAYDYACEKLQS